MRLVLRSAGCEASKIGHGLGGLAHLQATRAVGEVIQVGIAVEGAGEGRVGVHGIVELVGGVLAGGVELRVVPIYAAVGQRGVLVVHGRGREEGGLCAHVSGAAGGGGRSAELASLPTYLVVGVVGDVRWVIMGEERRWWQSVVVGGGGQ